MDVLPFALPDIGEAEIEAVSHCLRSGWLTSGPVVKEFEEKFAKYVGAKHAIAVNSATAGALLILAALPLKTNTGYKPTIIVPAITFSGPAMMARHLGYDVLFADVRDDFPNIAPASIDQLLDEHNDSIDVLMPTHFAGREANVNQLRNQYAERIDFVVDDAAHALPTRNRDNKMVGSLHSTATFFSFYATKTITSGEGGMICTSDDALAAKVRKLRLHGISKDAADRYTNIKTGWHYDIEQPGWKANLTDMAASLGLVQLGRSDWFYKRRHAIAQMYDDALWALPGITVHPVLPKDAVHLYPIRVSKHRDAFVSKMAELGVQCSMHFIPMYRHSYWQGYTQDTSEKWFEHRYPNSEKWFKEAVSLPLYTKMTDGDVARVIDAVKQVAKELAAI